MTTISPPMCLFCAHYRGVRNGGVPRCAAYPEQIPDAIYDEYADHRLPFAGDNGIRFQPDGDDAVEYVSDNYAPVEMAPSRAVV